MSNNDENKSKFHIDIRKNEIVINGVAMERVEPAKIVEILGEPRISKFTGKVDNTEFHRETWIYDELGIQLENPNNGEIPYLDFRLSDEEEKNFKGAFEYFHLNPKSLFLGQITVNKKPLISIFTDKQLREAYIFLEKKVGNWKLHFRLKEQLQERIKDFGWDTEDIERKVEMLRSEIQPFGSFYFIYEPPKVKKISSGKYTLRPANDNDLKFSNFNFKLAIIEELMYVQKVLTPEFDVFDFCNDYDKRSINPDDYIYKAIPEVKKWFQDLPIPAELALGVKELDLDGGNRIYLQIIPSWDGEDGYYDIKSITEEELSQFPNLKKVTGSANFFRPKAQKLMESKGVVFDF